MNALKILFFCLAFWPAHSLADLPPNWPWRGVVLPELEATQEDINYLAAVGVNSVHLFPGVRFVASRDKLSPRQAWIKTIAWLDEMLDASKRNNITAIIDMSQFPIDPALGIRQDSPDFWGSDKHLADALALIEELAVHMKGRGNELAAYQFFSEPLERRTFGQRSPYNWRSFAGKIIETIRRHDPDRFVIVSPGFGAESSSFKDYSPLPYDRIIYCVHIYNPHSYTHQGIGGRKFGLNYPGKIEGTYWDKKKLASLIHPVVQFKHKHNALIWVGEFSAARWAEGSNQYLEDLIELFDTHGFGWSYFNVRGYHGWDPYFDSTYSTDKRSDWKARYIGTNSPRWQMLLRKFASQKPQPLR